MAKPRKRVKVFVAMSGGVDSSVAAWLLANRGYEVVGVFMRCWSQGSPATSLGTDCTAEADATDARRVAARIGIPFYAWDFEDEYKKRVVDYMVEGYRRGITPNPDIMCNKEIKFGLFLEKALSMGSDYVATGHYVRLRSSANNESQTNKRMKEFANSERIRYALMVARDANKDQSYFLWTLTQDQLQHCLFPIGDYVKPEVREMARKVGLPTAEKKDSQGICFLGKVTLENFLGQYIPRKRGEILDVRGEKIGEHRGAQFYTIGQRHLGIANRKSQIVNSGDMKPVYVAEKDIKTNTLIVAEGDDHFSLYKKEIAVDQVHFINPIANHQLPMTVLARVRYRQPLVKARIMNHESGIKGGAGKKFKPIIPNSQFLIQFEEPVKFVATGQSAVFYVKDNTSSFHSKGRRSAGLRMLGGGVIAATIR
ncbi:tRNA 2-thiouridine(34) synthase MnmA [Candidatus Wolfebacteria bacterium]|nr:tRNA 2-thiouridine(34) synthase MnmA [Candidatus Wolfebacteria bacterium]